jgi:hypothetical protein
MESFDEISHAVGACLPHSALLGYPLLGLRMPITLNSTVKTSPCLPAG